MNQSISNRIRGPRRGPPQGRRFFPAPAFTLIELLIVVAIIAILAAIAVPNFLEASIRSKTSRAKADMRSIATALESYIVDYNEYPPKKGFVPYLYLCKGSENKRNEILRYIKPMHTHVVCPVDLKEIKGAIPSQLNSWNFLARIL